MTLQKVDQETFCSLLANQASYEMLDLEGTRVFCMRDKEKGPIILIEPITTGERVLVQLKVT